MLLNNLQPVTGGRPLTIRISGRTIASVSEFSENIPHNSSSDSLSFGDALVFPGLINSHDHLDFNLFPQLGNHIYPSYVAWGEDIHKQNKKAIEEVLKIPKTLRTQWGVYKNLLNGITTVVNHGPKTELNQDLITVYENCHVLHSVQMEKKWKLKLNLPFRKRAPFVIHVGEGTDIAANKEIDTLLRWNLFNRKLIGIHAIAMNEQQASGFQALIWCPDSNYFLIGSTARINKLKQHTRILFGTDSTVSADWNLWNHLRLARKENAVTDDELYEMMTTTASSIWNLPASGKIAANAEADLVIARKKTGSDPMEAFYTLNPEDLLMVMHKGEINLFDAELKERISNEQSIKNDFSKIRINGQCKYVKGNLNDLVSRIKTFHPGASFPFTVE
jgi:cytosine/adenosine deaminase-related metal-dependent hydrolase